MRSCAFTRRFFRPLQLGFVQLAFLQLAATSALSAQGVVPNIVQDAAPNATVERVSPSTPGHRFWTIAGITFVAAALTDAPVSDAIRGGHGGFAGHLASTVQPLGRAHNVYIGLGASLAAALITRQSAWATATWHIAAGYVAADAVTATLKGAIGRHRPNDYRGPYRFSPSLRAHNGWDSFPSGHATHVFAIAAGIASEVPNRWVAAGVYGIAATVGWSRVHDLAHWPSDVVAGSVIGIAASRSVIAWLDRAHHRSSGSMHTPASQVVLGPDLLAFSIRFR